MSSDGLVGGVVFTLTLIDNLLEQKGAPSEDEEDGPDLQWRL
jgi:hypothetical protein